MIANRNSEYCQPLTWIGRFPVYLATVIAGVLGISMVFTAIAMSATKGASFGLLQPLMFSPGRALGEGHVWQFFSYILINQPDFWAAIQIILLGAFGSEVEKFIGRRSFAIFYGILVVAIPIFLAAVWWLFKVNVPFVGSGQVNFAVFAAFVLIYPRAEIFFSIEARWVLAVLLGINTLMLLAAAAWPQLGALWWVCSVAALWMVREGVGNFSLPSPRDYFRQKHSERHLRVEKPEHEEEIDIDPILEKIARQGIGSLSRAERDRLEKARAALLEKDRGH